MAAFYIDNDVGADLAPALAAIGHHVTLTDDLELAAASDGRQLFTAADRGWVLLTHNGRDFIVLHDAWRFWTVRWNVAIDHAGIIVLPRSVRGRTWVAAQAAQQIDALVRSDEFAAGQLFTWSRTDDFWERRTREP